MLLPTQDKEAKTEVLKVLDRFHGYSDIVLSIDADNILKSLEKLGYYKGLPSNIEEALNSGDGVYRP